MDRLTWKVTLPSPATEYDLKYFNELLSSLEDELKNENFPSLSEEEDFLQALVDFNKANEAKNLVVNKLERLQKKKSATEEKELKVVKKELKQAEDLCGNEEKKCKIEARNVLQKPSFCVIRSTHVVYEETLVTWMILKAQTPKGATTWCNKGDDETRKVLSLLKSVELCQCMLENGGVKNGKYIEAFILFQELVKESTNNDVLVRLALAVALELCIGKIDPHTRFLHYKEAYLNGELDSAFSKFSVWELRMVIDSDRSNDELTFARESLRNYRPDFIFSQDPQWRYTEIVRSDVDYCDVNWTNEARTYDQILSGGGKCGPRAWYGRLVTKAFGIPTYGMRQTGHAAMSRWTLKGWKTCLGADFQFTYWEDMQGHPRHGSDFYLETKARSAVSEQDYRRMVLNLEFIATYYDEKDWFLKKNYRPQGKKDPWFSLAFFQKHLLADTERPGFLFYEHEESPNQADRLITTRSLETLAQNISDNIVVPASSAVKSKTFAQKVKIVTSFGGGDQISITSNVGVSYNLSKDLFTGEKYNLTIRLCSVHREQKSLVVEVKTGEDQTQVFKVGVPYTMGKWGETKPVCIELPSELDGTVSITLKRYKDVGSLAVKEITLTPV